MTFVFRGYCRCLMKHCFGNLGSVRALRSPWPTARVGRFHWRVFGSIPCWSTGTSRSAAGHRLGQSSRRSSTCSPESPGGAGRALRVKFEMAVRLLSANYELTAEQLGELIVFEPGDVASDEWDQLSRVLLGLSPTSSPAT